MHKPHKIPKIPKALQVKDTRTFDYKLKYYILDKFPFAHHVRHQLLRFRNRMPNFIPHLIVFLISPVIAFAFIYYFQPTIAKPPLWELGVSTQIHHAYAFIIASTIYTYNNIRLRVRIPFNRHF